MTDRLASGIEVSALIRRFQAHGGHGTVLARGDANAGAILLVLADRGRPQGVLERTLNVSGEYRWSETGPKNKHDYQEVNSYIERRRQFDTDLWVVELDIPGVERFAAEMIATG